MRLYADLTDEQLLAEITEMLDAKKELALGKIAVIAGEGRRIEYAPSQKQSVNNILRELGLEARERGLSIGGDGGGAIRVEIG